MSKRWQGNKYGSQSLIREARLLYDIKAILGMQDKRVIVCPLPMHRHHNNTPSFSVYMDHGVQKFRCHGACGQSGDVLDLVGLMQIPGYDGKRIDHLRRALSLLSTGYKIGPPRQMRKVPMLENTAWQSFIPAGVEVIEYAQTRGLTPETLKRFGVGQSSMYNKVWMTMPTFHMGRLMGVKMRNLDALSAKDRYTSLPGSIGGLFNANAVYYTTDPVLITKAEIPTMLMMQNEILTCSPTGGEASNEAELYHFVVWSRKRVVVKDNDLDPQVRAKMDAAAVKRAEMFHAELKAPPEEWKDIDSWFLDEPNEALATIRSWLT
jgi:hypothetical protein